MPTEVLFQINQRMVFLRIYEILFEAQQSLADRQQFEQMQLAGDPGLTLVSKWSAAYPFCYFTGAVLGDLLAQPIIWRDQHLSVRQALDQLQPDIEQWLGSELFEYPIDHFFTWQPHTLRVQELVDDVKQRVLEVVDAIHSLDHVHQLAMQSVVRVEFTDGCRQLCTAGIRHSVSFCYNGQTLAPIVHSAQSTIQQRWYMHAAIHTFWRMAKLGGEIRIPNPQITAQLSTQAPLYLV